MKRYPENLFLFAIFLAIATLILANQPAQAVPSKIPIQAPTPSPQPPIGLAERPITAAHFSRIEDENEPTVEDRLDIKALQIDCLADGRILIQIEYFDTININDHEQYFDLFIDVGARSSADAVISGSLHQYQYRQYREEAFKNLPVDGSWYSPDIADNQLIVVFPWQERVGSYEVARIWLVGGQEPRRTYGLDMLGERETSHRFFPQICWLDTP